MLPLTFSIDGYLGEGRRVIRLAHSDVLLYRDDDVGNLLHALTVAV